MSTLDELRKKFQEISENNPRSLTKRRPSVKENPSDLKLATLQKLPEVEITDWEKSVLEKGLAAFAEVTGYYRGELPIEAISEKSVAEIYLKYMDKPLIEMAPLILREYLERRVSEEGIESKLLQNRNTLVCAIDNLMVKFLRETYTS